MSVRGVYSAALAKHLASLDLVRYDGVGPVDAPLCFLEEMPDQPDLAVGVYSRTGFPAVDLSGYETPELQVIVRSPANVAPLSRPGWELLQAIRQAITRTDSVTWAPGSAADETEVNTCDVNEPSPVPLGADSTGRPRWSITCRFEVLETA